MMTFVSIACPYCKKPALIDINPDTHTLLDVHKTRRSLDQLKGREFQRYNLCGNCHNIYYITLMRIPRHMRNSVIVS
ncbi:MAG TPA: hypothetical protein VJZ27_20975 [Aggregatilineales bacterium]|nr:hypothetical protein [Aggregatilineales bacterium]